MESESIANTDLQKWFDQRLDEQRSQSAMFTNNSTSWDVAWWCYEFRQTRNLPPRSGYVAYTGIVVGGTQCGPGQSQTAYTTVKVLGDFADCGLVGLKNRNTGQTIPAFNFPDKVAAPGKFWVRIGCGIKDGDAIDGSDAYVEITAESSDGSVTTDRIALT